MEEQAPQPSPSVQPVQPASVAPEKKPGVLILAISLIAILLVAGGVYAGMRIGKKQALPNQQVFQPPVPTSSPTSVPTQVSEITSVSTPAENANWKSYTNTEYGFSVKYPDSMEAIPIQKRDEMLLGGVRFNLIYKDNQFRPQASEIHVWVYDGKNLSLDQWLSDNSTSQPFGSAAEKEFYNFKKTGTSKLGSKNGISFTNEAFGFNDTETAVEKGNFIYMVGYVKVSDDLSSVFDQILSTFKFTN